MYTAVRVRSLDGNVFHISRVHGPHSVSVTDNRAGQTQRRRRSVDGFGFGDDRPRRYLSTRRVQAVGASRPRGGGTVTASREISRDPDKFYFISDLSDVFLVFLVLTMSF